ncbi:hypothetical protein NEMBOFW57_002918 [Staphylotrichum longicolle]|uniref:Methyltransferase type 11 domain-containing protein n=1 Tax=Staphylotrichum longicolle TaxID=669026 RepID=A0AAD4F3R2_9PEZI|nr:hypothetical protein NEMBOFW57_002918 [Staphylotrichum longicolle]
MLDPQRVKREYDSIAVEYNSQYVASPVGALEYELTGIALGDLTGRTVLDLGGGSGIHARQAVDLGAAAVDIVDLSPGMMKVAEESEKATGRNVMRFFEADVAKPLSHLPLREEGYDVVMANWVLDFADSAEVLEGMFHNIVGYLKSGGLFVGVRLGNPHSTILQTGQYGVILKDMEPFPGGVKFRAVIMSEPPMEFDAATHDALSSDSPEVYEKAGLTSVEVIPSTAGSVVEKDPKYWADFLKEPWLAVVKAVKK